MSSNTQPSCSENLTKDQYLEIKRQKAVDDAAAFQEAKRASIAAYLERNVEIKKDKYKVDHEERNKALEAQGKPTIPHTEPTEEELVAFRHEANYQR